MKKTEQVNRRFTFLTASSLLSSGGLAGVLRGRRISQAAKPHEQARNRLNIAYACATAILLSAFLVFQVQPVIGKMILPWFGGGPAVWTVCMLFFQLVLLAGYGYAHLLNRSLPLRWQALVHSLLVAATLLLLPITPDNSWRPTDGSNPTERILLLLLASVGMPYFLLSATAPLLQAWYAATNTNRVPYRLYALSNLGSLTALLSFPFLVEPLLTTSAQGTLWSIGFGVFALLSAVVAALMWSSNSGKISDSTIQQHDNKAPGNMASDADDEKKAIGAKRWIVWLLLSSLGSVALLAITNQICQEITVVPLLWIVPLSIYLLTFIISFDRPQWFAPRWWGVATASTILAMCLYRSDFLWMVDHVIDMVGVPFSFRELYGDFVFEIFIYCLTLFLVCMTCHGELVRSKPEPHRLTSFYLAMSMGGALGGVFVAVFCPLLFSTFFETELVLAGGLLVAVLLIATDGSRHWSLSKGSIRLRAAIVLLAGMDLIVATVWLGDSDNAILRTRNFYGVLTVDLSETDNGEPGRSLYHGRTLHGFQFISNHLRREPTTYFSRESGVGVTLTALSQQEPLHVGVVGLGVGTVATYGRQGDLYHFYEINEDVIELAETSFSFLKDSAAEIKITRGDARVSLERQPQQEFDVLALDAFSGDGIPVHLLTAEAFLIYLKHISPNGVIAVHVTNRYVNLFPVVSQIADQYGMEMIHIATSYDDDTVADSSSDWLMLTYDKGFAKHKLVQQHLTILEEDHARIVWTDQFSSLLSVMK